MSPELREKINQSKLCHDQIRELEPLLPADDAELDGLLEETLDQGDQLGFSLVVMATLLAQRRADARHLERGLWFLSYASVIGNVAWKMEGDVAGPLLRGLTGRAVPLVLHAGVLLVAALWCMDKAGQPLPAELVAAARMLARSEDLPPEALTCLCAVAQRTEDQELAALLGRKYPAATKRPMALSAATLLKEWLVLFDKPVLCSVREHSHGHIGTIKGGTLRRSVEKHPRNAPCPCGSGQKYKRCCAEKDQQRLLHSTEVAGMTHAELTAQPAVGLTEARLAAMPAHELARLQLAQVPRKWLQLYLERLVASGLFDRMAEFFEIEPWGAIQVMNCDNVLFIAVRDQQRDLAMRVMKGRERHEAPHPPRPGVALLEAQQRPEEHAGLLEAMALRMLQAQDAQSLTDDELEDFGLDLLYSPYRALGIVMARSLLPLLPPVPATELLQELLCARDKLKLSPHDPYEDIIEKVLAERSGDEGKDAAALRSARKQLEQKAAEVRQLREEMQQQLRALELRARKAREAGESAASAPTAGEAELSEMREMRSKLKQVSSLLTERSEERTTLRQKLQKAQQDLEKQRQGDGSQGAAAASTAAMEEEAQHYLPEQAAGNQPLRLIGFPPRFREVLEDHPRQVARAAMAMIGRLAGGEPEAFAGVVQLKALPGVLRQRIGIEHRLLFRLGPDVLQVVDLIYRRDLDRKIKSLRTSQPVGLGD